MAPGALGFVATWWVISLHSVSVLSEGDSPRISSGEGNLRDGRPGLQQQQQQLLVQPDLFTELYFENFRLQTSVGAGIQSAAEGFSALTRARRGNPWPGVNIVGRDEKNWAGERRDGQNDEGASGGSGGSGGGNGYAASDSLAASLDLHESFDALARARRGTGDDSRSGADGGGGEEDNGNVVSGALEAFFEQYEGFAQEFASRSAFNFADASSKDFHIARSWGADVFNARSRGNNFVTMLHKLDHDIEQLEYLVAKKRLPKEFTQLAGEYKVVRELVARSIAETLGQPEASGNAFRALPYGLGPQLFERLRGTYNSLIHVPKGPAEGSLGGSHPTGFRRALNPNLDWKAIEEEYLSQELPILWFDGFLSPEALDGVLEYCREATVFFDFKPGYLGAYFDDGFTSPWLVQIANELQERLPRVLEGMALSNLWAYKYDGNTSMDGIMVHADDARVNLNFWVTPDDANLDPTSGGLVVYPKAPPSVGPSDETTSGFEVDMNRWNNSSQKSFIETWLKDEGVYDLAVKVPYRQNRIVMFDSRLLHESDKFHFREGYENRRINLTFLFSPAGRADKIAQQTANARM